MIEGQTALDRITFLRDLLATQCRAQGKPPPTPEEIESFLHIQMVGRSCMTRHNHIHYRINKVCIHMNPLSTFPYEDGEITYMDYFQRRHGIVLEPGQPMLHCPFRGRQELYVPSQIAFLTGLDERWKAGQNFTRDLWRGLRYDPTEHWRLQGRLTSGLASAREGAALREWGVAVDQQPLHVPCHELPHEPVFFNRDVAKYFRQAQR